MMVTMVNFMVVVVWMVIVIKIIMMFNIGVSVTHIIMMRNSTRMWSGKELGIDMMGPLRKEWSCTPFCMLAKEKITLNIFINIHEWNECTLNRYMMKDFRCMITGNFNIRFNHIYLMCVVKACFWKQLWE